MALRGQVIRSTGIWYKVRLEEGGILDARIKGKLRLLESKATNPIAVGDWVLMEALEDELGQASIVDIEDRRNYVARESPRKKHGRHILAANVDQAVLICSYKDPELRKGFIDRFSIICELFHVPLVLVFNKMDLLNDDEKEDLLEIVSLYADIGFEIKLCSAIKEKGLQEMHDCLKGKLSLMAGPSGVGKSSLLNVLKPGLGQKIKEISEYTGKGQHTTTFAEMFELAPNSWLIDSPGIKEVGLTHLEPKVVAHYFPEMRRLMNECRFSDCRHKQEPGCAIKEAIETGEIAYSRYETYCHVVDEIEAKNYWERD